MILNQIQIPFACPNPFLPPSAGDKALFFKQMLALHIQLVDDAKGLVELQVVEKIVQAKGEGGLGVALLAVRRINEDADADVFINGVEVVKVEAADGSAAVGEVNHQAELLLAEQVVVVQQELLDLEARVGYKRPAHAPHGAVVLPAVNLLGVVGLGATERNRVIFDEHGGFFSGWHAF